MTAQELKNSILQLAVQGKLVPQNAEDEPVSELLRHISHQKAVWIKEGKLKKEKAQPALGEDDMTFDIPESWTWLRLGDFCSIYNGNSINAEEKAKKYSRKCEGYSFIATKDVGFDHSIAYDNGVYIPANLEEFKIAPAGSVLLCMEGGSAGRKIGILEQDVCFGNKLCCLTPFVIFYKYLYYFLQSPAFFSSFTALMTGIIGGVGAAKIKSIAVPIPPLAEQERIVAKIEELLPLIEEYGEAEQKLSTLNVNFPEMLRKSILQQAVQGKLTARDPSDEPASELLKRIQAEKAKLIAEGKIKKEKPLPPITEDDCPFEIPDTWKWVRLGDIVRYQGGYAYKSDTYVKQSGNQVVRLGNVKNNALPLSVSPVYIPDHIAEETEDYRIAEDTILFTMTGTKGKRDYFYTCRIKEENLPGCKLYLNQRVGCLSAYSNIELDWLTIVLQSEPILSQIFATATGNANQANIGSVNTLKLLIPLPPLAEQKRIVARVEELLADCDMLKSVH